MKYFNIIFLFIANTAMAQNETIISFKFEAIYNLNYVPDSSTGKKVHAVHTLLLNDTSSLFAGY